MAVSISTLFNRITTTHIIKGRDNGGLQLRGRQQVTGRREPRKKAALEIGNLVLFPNSKPGVFWVKGVVSLWEGEQDWTSRTYWIPIPA